MLPIIDGFMVSASAPVADEVRLLLERLPEWFGQPDSNRAYVEDARQMATLVARDGDGTVVGVLLYCSHFAGSSEIHLMAVDPASHRRGVGRALITATESILRAQGTTMLSVKTLGPSFADAGYEATRAFYRACGFIPIEELALRDWDTPALLLVKSLA